MKTPVIVACLVLALALTVVLLIRRGGVVAVAGSAPSSDASLLLLGPTNLPAGTFARFCLSNSTRQRIACVPEAVERLTGGSWVRTPLMGGGSGAVANWIGLKEELKPGEGFTFLVPPPTNAGPWRLVFMCQEQFPVVDPLTDTMRHLTDANAMKTGLRQYSGRRYHLTSPEVSP
jgi:hypothetical protein